ncbi:MAG: hypothetical protein IJI83_06745 [Oscillospiraceae bacterium]|nr:hypothetical protein [Oscillospiraceae bacterium]MBQ6493298.1 hypothetical protein [Erysipelotrichaceae bacterium]
MNKIFKLVMCSLLLSLLCMNIISAADGGVVYDGKKIKVTGEADFRELLPGEEVSFNVVLSNTSNKKTEWYISNEVLSSFEESKNKPSDGGYTYKLSYNGKELYNSENIGGKDLNGLKQLNDETNGKFFYLGSLDPKATGTISVTVGLDGESQANDYMEAMADLQMKFAVEEEKASKITSKKTVRYYMPNTGIEEAAQKKELTAYYLIIAAAMIMMSASSAYLIHTRKEAR